MIPEQKQLLDSFPDLTDLTTPARNQLRRLHRMLQMYSYPKVELEFFIKEIDFHKTQIKIKKSKTSNVKN